MTIFKPVAITFVKTLPHSGLDGRERATRKRTVICTSIAQRENAIDIATLDGYVFENEVPHKLPTADQITMNNLFSVE